MFLSLYHEILYRPLFNALIFLYHFLGQDMGLAIILLTIVIRLILFYPSLSQLRAQRSLQSTQPKLKELKERYKNDKEGYNRAVLEFYKENKVNPFASCLPLVLQLIILIPLYQVFLAGVVTDPATSFIKGDQLKFLYYPLRVIYDSTSIHPLFLEFLNLANAKNVILAVLAGAATFWQSRMLLAQQPPKGAGTGAKDESQLAAANKSMVYFGPIITIIFAYQFPAGLALYWLVSTLLQIVQQYYFLRRHPKTA